MTRFGVCVLVVVASAVLGSPAATDVSPQGEVALAVRRNQQVPLPPDQALAMATLARQVGDHEAEVELLRRAVADGPFAEVAKIELAQAIVTARSDDAVNLVIPTLQDEGSPQLFFAARSIVFAASDGPLGTETKAAVLQSTARMSRKSRRTLEAALADPAKPSQRSRMLVVLEKYSGDLIALEVAGRLREAGDLSDREQWLVARCLYRHALYEEAATKLGRLTETKAKDVPVWEVRFLRGRCAFRLDQFGEAATWYRSALVVAPDRKKKAELLVHLARAQELNGEVDEAAENARRAILADKSDDRRLYLARLRLRTDRLDLAELGISRVRSSNDRDRGRVLIGLYHLGKGDVDTGKGALLKVRGRVWRGPATVVAAKVLASEGSSDEALGLLEKAAPELDEFWGCRAREIMRSIDDETRAGWRKRRFAEAQGDDQRAARRALRELAVLEPLAQELGPIRDLVAAKRAVDLSPAAPPIRGLAAELYAAGLHQTAVRWFPGGFPTAKPSQALWSGNLFLKSGAPWRSIRVADAAWRMLGSDLPMRVYPDVLEAAAYPATFLEQAQSAGEASGVEWEIVAGVAREESRWDADVLSRVGARGLMQLMPRTAQQVAQRLEIAAPDPEELFDPALSLKLGAAELARLVQAFNGFTAPAIAAYNAGEAQSRLWLEQCGKGCDVDRFALTVSFSATRGYTKDVLASAKIYGRRFRDGNEEPQAGPELGPTTGQSLD